MDVEDEQEQCYCKVTDIDCEAAVLTCQKCRKKFHVGMYSSSEYMYINCINGTYATNRCTYINPALESLLSIAFSHMTFTSTIFI